MEEFDHTLNGKSFDEMASDPEFTEEDLRKELAAYTQALKEEFEASIAQEPENIAEHSQTFFAANVPSAIAQIVWLSIHAESDTVKLNASKYIVEQAKKTEEADKDPVSALLRQLAGNDKKKQPAGGDAPAVDNTAVKLSAEEIEFAKKPDRTPEQFLAEEGTG